MRERERRREREREKERERERERERSIKLITLHNIYTTKRKIRDYHIWRCSISVVITCSTESFQEKTYMMSGEKEREKKSILKLYINMLIPSIVH